MKKLFLLFLLISFIAFTSCSKPEDTEETRIKITILKGKVEVLINGDKKPAKINMILKKNDEVITYNGQADLIIGNIGIMKVKANSVFKISSISRDIKLKLNRGKLLLALNKLKKDTTFYVESPTAVVGVRGTSFLITVSAKESKVGVLTGKVEVKSAKGSITVNELKEVSVVEAEIQNVTSMNITTIVDVKDMLKIKNIETVEGYKRIKSNIKKLEIIESAEGSNELNVDAFKNAIQAKDMEDGGVSMSEELKKKSAKIKKSSIDSSKQGLVKDEEF